MLFGTERIRELEDGRKHLFDFNPSTIWYPSSKKTNIYSEMTGCDQWYNDTESEGNPIQRVVHKNRLAASANLVLHHFAKLIIFIMTTNTVPIILTTNTVPIMHDDQYCPYHPPLLSHQHHAARKYPSRQSKKFMDQSYCQNPSNLHTSPALA